MYTCISILVYTVLQPALVSFYVYYVTVGFITTSSLKLLIVSCCIITSKRCWAYEYVSDSNTPISKNSKLISSFGLLHTWTSPYLPLYSNNLPSQSGFCLLFPSSTSGCLILVTLSSHLMTVGTAPPRRPWPVPKSSGSSPR